MSRLQLEIGGFIPSASVDVPCECSSVSEAVREFRKRYRTAVPATVTHGGKVYEIIGFDEGTGEPILDGDRYEYDGDAVYTLISHADRNRHLFEAL